MKQFNFIFKGDVYFGIKSRNNIHNIIENNGYESTCVIIDHALISVPIFSDYINELQCDVKIIECDISEPTYENDLSIFLNTVHVLSGEYTPEF